MMAAQPFLDRLVDHPVVDGRRLPAHPTDHADSAHPEIRLKLKVASFTLTLSVLRPSGGGRFADAQAGPVISPRCAQRCIRRPSRPLRRAPKWGCTGKG